ncbi:Wzz/FepE/Etk N-terminal domain-containing protein [Jannaschia sp. W003]|uniref:Wzz/FepE/Etk N-terminal domain-containing protein n=1 Tax=Jannaschia sp. W003 TaxID=2867012 RepID=UPI0021A6DE8D|nr:Wzz/FepE/Etk N-terminal domain-containing protein [Jannaschia sp. W003]UWQ21848.1 lipopolysaccharide biosynthesis protein [Jannaschia sp. W003]
MADLAFLLALFRRRAHWFALVAALVAALGLLLAMLAPATYRASAKLVVESEKIPDTLAASTVRTQALEHLHIIEQHILARETLVEMAARMGLPGPEGTAGDALVEDLRARIAVEITGDASVRQRAEATLLSLAVDAATPQEAAAITNELVTLVLAEDVAMRTSVARQTLDFFAGEVARLEAELTRAAAAILAFREEHREALPDSLEFRRARVALLREQLVALDARQDEVERRERRQVRLHRSIHGIDDTAADPARPLPSAAGSAERRRLRGLRAQRDALPRGDPARAEFDRRIAALERLVDDAAAAAPRSAYERRLDDFGTELAELEARRAGFLAEIDALERSIAATAGLGTQLAALERDEGNLRAQYDEAVAARAVAETGDAIETLSRGQRVAVIEQAVPPSAPHSPNRVLIAAGGLAAGVALGLLVVSAMVLLTGDLRRPADLVAGLGIAPFGTLPYLCTRAERRHARLRLAGGTALAALLLAGGLSALHLLVAPLDLLAAAVLRDGPGAIPEMIRLAVLERS